MPFFILAGIILISGYFGMDYYNKLLQAKSDKEKFYVFDELFRKYAAKWGVPEWRWLKAISKQESDLGQNERVINRKVSYDGKSYGIMQIAQGIGSPKEIEIKGHEGQAALDNPEISIDKAAHLISYLWKKYGDRKKVFLAYNQGEANTDKGKDYTVNYSADKVSYADKIERWLSWIYNREQYYKEGH